MVLKARDQLVHILSDESDEPLARPTLEHEEAVRRALLAAFPDRVTIGWDVAITDRGPVIIEGNAQSGCDMIQRTDELPAGIGRLAECYAYHVDRALERGMSLAWKVRKGLIRETVPLTAENKAELRRVLTLFEQAEGATSSS